MMSPEKALRRALASGAELEIDGKVMNASRQRVKPAPVREVPKPAAAPVPAPVVESPKPAGITREEVQAMLDARDATWQAMFAELSAKINAPKPAPKRAKKMINFTYENGVVKTAEITDKE